jgi:hypothetical protein
MCATLCPLDEPRDLPLTLRYTEPRGNKGREYRILAKNIQGTKNEN